MRVKDVGGLHRIALWTLMAVMLCALAPEAVASGLMPSLGVIATALSLTLITAVSANQK